MSRLWPCCFVSCHFITIQFSGLPCCTVKSVSAQSTDRHVCVCVCVCVCVYAKHTVGFRFQKTLFKWYFKNQQEYKHLERTQHFKLSPASLTDPHLLFDGLRNTTRIYHFVFIFYFSNTSCSPLTLQSGFVKRRRYLKRVKQLRNVFALSWETFLPHKEKKHKLATKSNVECLCQLVYGNMKKVLCIKNKISCSYNNIWNKPYSLGDIRFQRRYLWHTNS